MTARMVATNRRYTKEQKQAYRDRVAKRRRPRMWLNGKDITDLLGDFKLEPWQAWFLEEFDKRRALDLPVQPFQRHHFADRMGRRVPTVDPDAMGGRL